MIVDPKMQRMFERCHEQKQHIDRMMRLIRAAMFLPPALLLVLMTVNIVSSTVSGFMMAMLGGSTGGPPFGPVSFIISAVLAAFSACCTMLEIPKCMDISNWAYPAGAGLCVILAFLYGERLILITLALYCIAALFLNLLYKRFYSENELLKPLKGYPHFNILLMSEKDLKEPEKTDEKPLDEMTPDERLMYEREH